MWLEPWALQLSDIEVLNRGWIGADKVIYTKPVQDSTKMELPREPAFCLAGVRFETELYFLFSRSDTVDIFVEELWLLLSLTGSY